MGSLESLEVFKGVAERLRNAPPPPLSWWIAQEKREVEYMKILKAEADSIKPKPGSVKWFTI